MEVRIYPSPEGLSVFFTDVTARKQAEEALRDSERRFRTVVETLGEGIMITDLEDRVLYTNSRNCEITGYAPDELIGRIASELLLPPKEQERMRKTIRDRAEGRSGV